jgi:predicted alpha/beta-hydrolase family hydrolase
MQFPGRHRPVSADRSPLANKAAGAGLAAKGAKNALIVGGQKKGGRERFP